MNFYLWQLLADTVGNLINQLRIYAGGILGRAMLALGIGTASYTFMVPEVLAWVQGYFNTLDGDTLQLLGYINVDRALNLVISAVAAKLGMQLHLVKFQGTPP